MCIHLFIYILIYISYEYITYIYIYSSTQGCKAGARKDCKHKIAECASQQLFSLRFLGKEKRIQELHHWKKQCSILMHWFRDPEVLEVFERTVYQRLRTCGQKVQMWCGSLSFRKPRSLRVYSCPKRLGPELYKRLGAGSLGAEKPRLGTQIDSSHLTHQFLDAKRKCHLHSMILYDL